MVEQKLIIPERLQSLARQESWEWDEGIDYGKQLLALGEGVQWELGRLASNINTKYGEHTIERLAIEIGLSVNTLWEYRKVYQSFNQLPAQAGNLGEVPYTVARELKDQEDRFELVKEVTTKKEAVQIVKARKKAEERKKADDRFRKKQKQSGYQLAHKLQRDINALVPLNGNVHNSIALLISSGYDTSEEDRLVVEQALIGLKSRVTELITTIRQSEPTGKVIDITPSKMEIEHETR